VSDCHCLLGHWGWRKRPFYAYLSLQRFETAKTQGSHRATNFVVTHNAALGRLWPDETA